MAGVVRCAVRSRALQCETRQECGWYSGGNGQNREWRRHELAELNRSPAARRLSTRTVWLVFAVIWVTIYFASLFSPPLLDDVDAAHAQAAQHMAESGDLITAKTNGIRYIEKPPLPYWRWPAMYKIFGQNTFATHLPNALAMLGLTWLAWLWARRAWGDRAGFYAGLGVLTSVGCFLFTRFIIPEAILALFSADCAVRADREPRRQPAGDDLLGVGRRGAGAADEGLDCAGILSAARRFRICC